MSKTTVKNVLKNRFDNRVYAVEDDKVWVSGMNAKCATTARLMASELARNGIPTGQVHDDGAARFGGVQFRYGDNA